MISNAIKVAQGGKKIAMRIYREQDGGVAVQVMHRGCRQAGKSSAADRHPLFNFSQTSDEALGPGLDMLMVRRLIELHGGRLELDGAGDRDARSTVFFPANRLSDVGRAQ